MPFFLEESLYRGTRRVVFEPNQADIECGIVNIEVSFAPLRPAKFIVIRVVQHAPRSGCRCRASSSAVATHPRRPGRDSKTSS
jgi:phage tail sheath protein FI